MFTRAPGPKSGFESGSQSTWERWSESGFESSLPPCINTCNQDLDQNPRVNGAIVFCYQGVYIMFHILEYVTKAVARQFGG